MLRNVLYGGFRTQRQPGIPFPRCLMGISCSTVSSAGRASLWFLRHASVAILLCILSVRDVCKMGLLSGLFSFSMGLCLSKLSANPLRKKYHRTSFRRVKKGLLYTLGLMLIRAPLKSPLNRSPTIAWETLGGLFQSAGCFSQSISLPGFLTPLEKMEKKGHQHWNQKLLFLCRKVTPLLHETCGALSPFLLNRSIRSSHFLQYTCNGSGHRVRWPA